MPERNHATLFAWPGALERRGVICLNRRNLDYILEQNPRQFYPRVDDKLITKQFCQANGIPVPETYAVVGRHGDVPTFMDRLGERQEFVIKPASGAAGRGILVIAKRNGMDFEAAGGRLIRRGELRYHVSTILSGLFSLGGQLDRAIIEQRIIIHPVMEGVAVGGTPDIRVILYHNVPVMAMVRLPTSMSDGRANLHQGAAATAVNLSTGTTFGGVCNNRRITHHPDTEVPIAGWEIPGWHQVLESSMRLADVLGLGFLGVDFVINTNNEPVVLEANARPGLAIQLAHGCGLGPRLAFVESQDSDSLSYEHRWDLMRQMAEMQ